MSFVHVDNFYCFIVFRLPDWGYTVIDPNGPIKKIVEFYFQMQSATPEMARLKMGFLLKEMLNHFTQKINSKLEPNRSLWLYSAHDFTISNFLNSLGLFEVVKKTSIFDFSNEVEIFNFVFIIVVTYSTFYGECAF